MKLRTIESKDGQKDAQQNSKNFNFTFGARKGECKYQNIATINKITNEAICPNQISVSNQICKQNGEFLEKVTTIKFNNEVITIKDSYKFIEQAHNTHEGAQQKRVQIFKKPLHSEGRAGSKSRLTKNLPKNFIKAFLNFLESIKDQENKQLVDCKMKLILSKQKFNNSFIQQIVDDSQLEPYFSTFLKQFAPEWILNSKIRDKEIHMEAVKIFERLCESQREPKLGKTMLLEDYLESFSENSQEDSKEVNESDKESIIANSSKSQNQDFE